MQTCKCGRELVLALEEVRGECARCYAPLVTVPSRKGAFAKEALIMVRPIEPEPTVTLPTGVAAGSVTKQQRYRAKNPDKTRADTKARVRRHRGT